MLLGKEAFVTLLNGLIRPESTEIASFKLEAKAKGRFHKGDRIVLVAFGAGLTWGATLVEW